MLTYKNKLFILTNSNGTQYSMQLHQFDVDNETWTNVTAQQTGSIPSSRIEYGIAYDEDNSKLYLMGGRSERSINMALSDAYMLDVASLQWKALPALPTEPSLKTNMTLVGTSGNVIRAQDGEVVLFIGGINLNIQTLTNLSQILTYNTYRDQWKLVSATGTPPTQRRSAIAIQGVHFYLIFNFAKAMK
jgi:N-acetylneuraminic acid mutarotase